MKMINQVKFMEFLIKILGGMPTKFGYCHHLSLCYIKFAQDNADAYDPCGGSFSFPLKFYFTDDNLIDVPELDEEEFKVDKRIVERALLYLSKITETVWVQCSSNYNQFDIQIYDKESLPSDKNSYYIRDYRAFLSKKTHINFSENATLFYTVYHLIKELDNK